MNETKQKLIIYRSISDENSHFPQEINVYISDYIKKLKLKNNSEVKICNTLSRCSLFEILLNNLMRWRYVTHINSWVLTSNVEWKEGIQNVLVQESENIELSFHKENI